MDSAARRGGHAGLAALSYLLLSSFDRSKSVQYLFMSCQLLNAIIVLLSTKFLCCSFRKLARSDIKMYVYQYYY